MKLAFSICSLTCLPWSFHTFLCLNRSHNPAFHPLLSSLSLSLFLPSTSLQTCSPINLSWTFSPLHPSPRTPKVKQGNMEQIPVSHIPNMFRETHVHCTINMHSAHGTASKRQMPANASKTDRIVFTGNKNDKLKHMQTQEDKTLKQQHLMFWMPMELLFLSAEVQANELLKIFPSLLPFPPRDHPVCLGTRAPLHWVRMERTYERVYACKT